MNAVLKDLLEVGVLDFIEVVKDVNLLLPLPIATKEGRNIIYINIIQQCWEGV